MTSGIQKPRGGARGRRLFTVFLVAGVALAPGCDSERAKLPTEAEAASGAVASADALVERMPIIRIPRRRSGGPTATPTLPGPGPTATPGPSATPGATATPGPSATHAPTATPSPTAPAAPTATPTASAPVAIRLRGISWQWDFFGPSTNGGPSITLKLNQAYRIEFFDDGPEDSSFHTFSGISALGLSAVSVAPGQSVTQSFTPRQTGTFQFACTNSSCGIGHDDMAGSVTVVP